MMQLTIPRAGIRGYKGALNVFKSGVLFLSLTTEKCRIMWVDKSEMLVIAAVCIRSETNARIVISTPMTRIEMYGVPNLA